MTLRCDARPSGGFTLIEVLVTLTVLGFALVLVTGYKPPWSRSLGLKGTAAELAADLRLARSEAIARNRSVAFDVDVNAHRYRIGTGKIQSLPSQFSIELMTIAGEKRQEGAGDILFNPDGTSSGGRITLADGQRSMVVGVDWLTGRVSVANVR
jgi:general secretion pathway protein H